MNPDPLPVPMLSANTFSRLMVTSMFVTFVGCASDSSSGRSSDGQARGHFEITAHVVDSVSPKLPIPGENLTQPHSAREPPARQESIQRIAKPPATPSIGQGRIRSYRPLNLYFPEETSALAQTSDEVLLMNVAESRPPGPVSGRMYDQPVLASYLGGNDDCRVVAITYLAMNLSETWEACANGHISLLTEAEAMPDLADDGEFASIRQMMTHTAYSTGLAITRYGEYLIQARSTSSPDENACKLVETVVTWQGRGVELREEQICSQE